MFAYGVFFDRYNLTEKVDFQITQEQCERILDEEDETQDILGKEITAFVAETAIRTNFKNVGDLVHCAKKGKPLVLDDEESLIVLAATRDAARLAFLDVHTDQMAEDFE